MKILKTTFKLNIFSLKMNIFSFLIVCAALVGSQAIKDEPPKINFGMCNSELSMLDASGILSYFNDPENADLKELLRYMRDIVNEHQFDKLKTHNVMEKIMGESEMTYLLTEMVLDRRELNKKASLCIINKILGENGTRVFDIHDKGFMEVIRKLRFRVKNLKFDEDKSRAFIEDFFGKSKIFDQFSELLKTGVEMIKPMLLNFFNLVLGDKTEGSFFQDADFKKLLRNLRAILLNYKVDEDDIRDFLEEDMELGENELTEVLPELFKIRVDMSKHKLVDYINSYLGDKETEWDYAYQQAEFVKRLRKLRDMIQNYIFNENGIRAFVEIVFELKTSQMTHRISDLIKILLEMLKQILSDLINIYLGDEKTPGAFSQTADLKKLKLLRYRLLIRGFDEEYYFRGFIGRSLEQSELADLYFNEVKTRTEGGRQTLLNFVDKILEDREAQGTDSKEQPDPNAVRQKKRLEKLISRMRYNLASREGVRENKLLMKKAIAGYEKLLILGLDLSEKFKRTFEELLKFDRLSSSKF